ncbi:MAG: Chromate transport protein ChrA [Hyphomicrobiales bacterium]|nr:Chromate transport protein ChrA [Hyphomicrobiales bacterium]
MQHSTPPHEITAREAPPRPTFAQAFRVWLRIGLLSFGGPAGQIALMHKELVEERRWISEARFLHALNYCMLLPGPEAQQLAIYIGWLLHGARGGVVAGVLFVLPGFCVILALATLYAVFQDTHWLGSLFFGLKAAVLAIVIEAVWRVGKRALRNGVMVSLAAGAFGALFVFDAPFPLVVLAAGLIGYVGARNWPKVFEPASHGGGEAASVLGDETAHPPASWGRSLKVAAVWGALWLLPFVALGAVFGWRSAYVDIASFFSKMAVVTFGGAYAVLAYVAQQAVETHHWLEPGEMLDGLAMAETTPGPLILVLTYVGFLAGFRNPLGLTPLGGGVLGAVVTTWVTFVPCFLWIFLGAPFVERIRGNKALSGALAAITAAVVGVILNLAIWFALHVLFREMTTIAAGPASIQWPVLRSLDVWAALLALVAVASLLKFRLGVPGTLAICAVLGFAIRTWT